MASESERFKILSFDDGGIKGAFSAAVFREWGKRTGDVITSETALRVWSGRQQIPLHVNVSLNSFRSETINRRSWKLH
jgi:hypothetical protein